ncbi:histidine kinase [Burkholderia lata]|uniref:sensor histidine kinase n=1 Tax=Burkholderia lata (strain ATCC 17760 / DSM 23089 / LMG 22485 / NCIMB 9086 / R18194 / 383) TaxID=482957 RepID=UPI001452BA04|nr:sensor histidine kinase [Burkholderia lata]VWD63918.1 histidine kinase [Burkholderia lata]
MLHATHCQRVFFALMLICFWPCAAIGDLSSDRGVKSWHKNRFGIKEVVSRLGDSDIVIPSSEVEVSATVTPSSEFPDTLSISNPMFLEGWGELFFSIKNNGSAERNLVLAFETARIEEVICFDGDRGPNSTQFGAGAAVRLSEWTDRARRPALFFSIAGDDVAFISCKLKSDVIFSPNPRLYSVEAYNSTERRSALVDGILIGGLLSMAWACAVIGVLGRNRTFWMFSIVCLVVALYEASLRGYGQFYLWPESPEWNYRSPTILAITAGLLSSVFVLLLVRQNKVLILVKPFFMVVAILYGSILMLAVGGAIHVASKGAIALGGVFFLMVTLVGLWAIRLSVPGAKWIAISTVIGLINYLIVNVGVMRHAHQYFFSKISDIQPNPMFALGGMLAYLTVLAAWVNSVNRERQKSTETLMVFQRDEKMRLSREIEIRTAQLSQALKYAESKNEEKIFMMGYIAHDLRAPLLTISQYIGVEGEGCGIDKSNFAEIIDDNIKYVLLLIDELILHVESEAVPLVIQPAPVEIERVLASVSAHADILARRNLNKYIFKKNTSSRLEVVVDEKRLRQLLLNLISNSANFCHHGVILLEYSASLKDGGWEIVLSVSDTGPGISPEKIESIFEPFQRELHSASPGGLGLFISKRIADKMGGALTVRSELKRGTCFDFFVTVPAKVLAGSFENFETTRGEAVSHEIGDSARIPFHICCALSELARAGAISEIDDMLSIMEAENTIPVDIIDAMKMDVSNLNLDRISRLCG